jgi:hypothetical protein
VRTKNLIHSCLFVKKQELIENASVSLLSLGVHYLMHALIRNAELPGEAGLRNAGGISGADEGVTFLDAERLVRLRGIIVDEIQGRSDQIFPWL